MSDEALEVRLLRSGYGSIEVLHGVDLSLRRGSVLAVLGPNGAGKSTLLRCIAGVHPVTSGEVRLGGRNVRGWSAHRLARNGLCLIPEGRGVFPRLSVRENLWMLSHLGTPRQEIEELAFARFPRLAERRDQIAGTLSGGEQQMLALARAVVTKPSVLMIDELSMGLAPNLVDSLYENVRAIAAEGVSVLVVEQFARVVLGMADRALVMASGRVVQHGTPLEVEGHLSSAYLGS